MNRQRIYSPHQVNDCKGNGAKPIKASATGEHCTMWALPDDERPTDDGSGVEEGAAWMPADALPTTTAMSNVKVTTVPPPPTCTIVGDYGSGPTPCVFPFLHNGQYYTRCVATGSKGTVVVFLISWACALDDATYWIIRRLLQTNIRAIQQNASRLTSCLPFPTGDGVTTMQATYRGVPPPTMLTEITSLGAAIRRLAQTFSQNHRARI